MIIVIICSTITQPEKRLVVVTINIVSATFDIISFSIRIFPWFG